MKSLLNNNKICFFIVSHGKLDCLPYQAAFFKQFRYIKNFEVIIYDNSSCTEEQVLEAARPLKEFCPVTVLAKRHNAGYFLGQLYALNECYDLLKQFDIVVHHTVDSFFVKDNYLFDWLLNFKVHEAGLLCNQYLFRPGADQLVTELTMGCGTDVFIFDPKKLDKQYWELALSYGNIPPELIMHKATNDLNKLVLIWSRMFVTIAGQHICAPDPEDLHGLPKNYLADAVNICHTHDLGYLNKYL